MTLSVIDTKRGRHPYAVGVAGRYDRWLLRDGTVGLSFDPKKRAEKARRHFATKETAEAARDAANADR